MNASMSAAPHVPVADRSRLLAVAAFVLAFLAIAGAWASQLFMGLVPCELCLEQRMAYYFGLPILLVALLLWSRVPRSVWLALMLAAAAVFVWGTYMGGYHAGVEYGFWPGPTACTGLGVEVNFSDLTHIDDAKVIPCDKVQFRFLGITLAGYNTLVSLATVLLIATAALVRKR